MSMKAPPPALTITAPPQLRTAPSPDERIIIGGLVIIIFGVIEATQENKSLTPVLEGGIVVLGLSALAAALSPRFGDLAAAFVILAAGAVAISELPTILGAIQTAVNNGTIGLDKQRPPITEPNPIEPGIGSSTTTTTNTGGGIALE